MPPSPETTLPVSTTKHDTTRRPFWHFALALALFYTAFSSLAVGCYTQKSATWDEPPHLLSGYYALRHGDYRVDSPHPPLVRMWAALPLLAKDGVQSQKNIVDQFSRNDWIFSQWLLQPTRWLYRQNDGDRLLYPARFMIVLLGLALGTVLFAWAYQWLGFWPAVLAMFGCVLEPNLLAHSTLVTTDFGLTHFFTCTCYFLWRTTRKLTWFNMAGLLLSVAAAFTTKFSALLLCPVGLILLSTRALGGGAWEIAVASRTRVLTTRAGRLLAVLALGTALFLSTYLAIWGVYRFRFAPAQDPTWTFAFEENRTVREYAPATTAAIAWINAHHLLPQAYGQGFLFMQATTHSRPSFLAGHYSDTGWWYYFPIAFLLKTPIGLLVLAGVGAILCLRRWRASLRDTQYLVVPLCFITASALVSHINIGIRHILPIFPLVILLATWAAVELFRHKLSQLLLLVACVCWAAEAMAVYPHPLAFFNVLAGGPEHGRNYLSNSNLDWGQDLKGLGAWMHENNVPKINLAYSGKADPAYYGIEYNNLPGADVLDENHPVGVQLPGFVAVSVSILVGADLNAQERAFYQPLSALEPIATIGHSIHIYWMEKPWWPPSWQSLARPASATPQ